MSELKERKPRIRDDSRVRTLMLATKARQSLGLPAKAIDWQKLYEKVNYEYTHGRTEAEIDWKQVVVDCKLEAEPWSRKLTHGLAKTFHRYFS